MIVYKQACQVLRYRTSKYRKTDTFSTSAEISLSGNVPFELYISYYYSIA